MGHLVLVDHLVLLHLLDCDHFTVFLVTADANLAEGATPDNLQRIEVTYRNPCTPTQC